MIVIVQFGIMYKKLLTEWTGEGNEFWGTENLICVIKEQYRESSYVIEIYL